MTSPVLLSCTFGLLLVHATSGADAASEAPDAWVFRTFRTSADLIYLQDSSSQPAPLPRADASEKEMLEHVRHVTNHLRRYFDEAGITLPEGTAFLHDPESGTLAVRTTAERMELLASWAHDAIGRVPLYLSITLDLLQADGATVRQIVQETSGQGDHATVWQRLEKLSAQGKAVRLETLRLMTRSGRRVDTQCGEEMSYESGFTLDDKGGLEWNRDTRCVGTRLEVDPVIGQDGLTVDVNLALEHHFAPPEERRMFVGQTTGQGRLEMPGIDFHSAKLQTAVTLLDGRTQLLGVWKPEGRPEFAADVLRVAFLRANCVRNLPAENATLHKRLAAVADKAVPIPARKPVKVPAPIPGMETRRFKVPRDFLSVDGGGHASPDPLVSTDQQPARRPATTAKGILVENGIPFSEGATAHFDPATSTLIVTNTPQNLDAVDAFTNSTLDGGRPHLVIHTLEIVQADADVLRSILAETATIADHAEALRKLENLAAEGKAQVLSTLRIPTRSGQRALAEVGLESMGVAGFTRDDKGRLKATTDSLRAGTRIEVEPVVGPDGRTIDVNAAVEFHYAPPGTISKPAPADEKTLMVAAPATAFHVAKLTIALTLDSGMTRLIGLWKPEGVPPRDGKEQMQAAFLQVTLVQVEP